MSGFSEESPKLLTRAHSREVLAAMFLLAGSLLVLEITTTRVLSVAMAYHFAVLSISLAMPSLSSSATSSTRWVIPRISINGP